MPPVKKKVRKPVKQRASAAKIPSARKESAGLWFERLIQLQARLRAPNGCPWDVEQTHLTLRTYLIEEAYEVLEALESGNDAKFAEELGDLLLQVVFHAQIAAEQERFTAADVVREIHQKMVRRHPHVFGEKRAKDATEVLKNWEKIKAEERRAESGKGSSSSVESEKTPASLLDGIPHTLPAVMQGFQLTRRASRIGFDWDNVGGVVNKLQEELAELRKAQSSRQIEEELGDVLLRPSISRGFLKSIQKLRSNAPTPNFLRGFARWSAWPMPPAGRWLMFHATRWNRFGTRQKSLKMKTIHVDARKRLPRDHERRNHGP